MEKVITALKQRKKTAAPTRLTKNSKLLKAIINAIQEKKGDEIVALDLRNIDEAVADFFILCEGKSNIQVNAIAGNVEEVVKKECAEHPYHVERGDHWTLVDYVNVVVHIFQHDHRQFYNLETLWADAPRIEY